MATRIFGASKGNRRPTQVAPSKTPTVRPTAQKGGGGNKAAGSVEPTAANTPTVSVSPTGEVSTQNFASKVASRQEHAREVASRRRVRKVKSYVRQRDAELAPKREVKVSKDFLDKAASPKPVTVAEHSRKLPGSEAPRAKPVKVAEHQRAAPTFTKAEEEVLQRDAGGRKLQKQAERVAASSKPKLKGTPEERQAARAKVRQAKKAVRESKPVIEAGLGPEQQRFVEGVAKETHLNPRTIAAQARAEESEGAQTEAEGTHNFLNMGPGIRYSSLKEGIDATAHNYNHGPYEGVRATRGQPAAVQAKAIAESPWGTGPLIEETLSSVHVKPGDPKAKARLKAAVREAKELGLKVSTLGIQKPGPAPKRVVTRYKAARTAMNELDARNNRGEQPYVWGGGHGTNPIGGADCSGSVSYVLVKTHVLKPGESLVSGDMGSVLAPGPGALTVFYNDEHTFIYDAVKHEFWGTSQSNSGGGAGYFPTSVGESEVAEGNSSGAYHVGHIPGLGRKQALQMGGSLGGLAGGTGSSGSIPGMTVAPSGTTAAIDEGQGTKVEGKAKFSKKPIELTPFQELTKRVKKLKQLGVEIALPGKETRSEAANKPGDASLHAQLRALESKYSVGAI